MFKSKTLGHDRFASQRSTQERSAKRPKLDLEETPRNEKVVAPVFRAPTRTGPKSQMERTKLLDTPGRGSGLSEAAQQRLAERRRVRATAHEAGTSRLEAGG